MEKEEKVQQEDLKGQPKELWKVFEENAIHNIKLCVEHGNNTRKVVREAQEEIVNLRNTVMAQQAQIDQMKQQIAVLLQNKFQGGS